MRRGMRILWDDAPEHRVVNIVVVQVCFWFGAVSGQCAQILGFLGVVCGHIVELEGRRGPSGTGKSSCTCRVAIVSLHLAVFSRS